MKKTCVFLASILLFILLFYACEMPGSIELKTENFKMNAPIKIASFNLATILTEVLKSSFPEGEGFEIYDMVNYKGVQAFLVGYQMDLLKSFNPDDYLKMPEGIKPINPEPIIIPKMTREAISNTWFYFEMQAFFDDMRDKINLTTPPTPFPSLDVTHGGDDTQNITLPVSELPPFMVFRNGVPGDDNFEAAIVQTGRIVLNISLVFDDPTDPDLEHLEITLAGIKLKGSDSDDYIGIPAGPQTATLKYDSDPDKNFKDKIIVNFKEGEEVYLADPPQFSFNNTITSHYDGTLLSSKTFDFSLVMQPQIQNITLSGAVALKIGYMEKPVPPEIIQKIKMDSVDDMVNAQIQDGYFKIEATPPHSDDEVTNTTYCRDLDIGYNIVIQQDPPDSFLGVSTTECLDGKTFTSANHSLADEWISGKELTVNDGISYITIQAKPGGTTFRLFHDTIYARDPLGEEVMPIEMNMEMNIDELKLVRWETVNGNGDYIIPPINIPDIDFSNMGEEKVSFIRSITFSDVKLNIDFTMPTDPPPSPPLTAGGAGLSPELNGRLALKVSCPDLGFEDDDPDHTKVLQNGPDNTFTGKEPTLGAGIELKVHENEDDPAKIVPFDVELIPVIGGVATPNSPYMEFGPVSGTKQIEMHIYGQVSVEFHWTEAVIDLNTALEATGAHEGLTGTYPKNDGGESGVDLSKMGEYLSGITIGDVAAKLFVSGPEKIVAEIHPSLKFDAQWQWDDNGVVKPDEQNMFDKPSITVGKNLPPLPGKDKNGDWVYSETVLPLGEGIDLEHFDTIIAAFPRNLRFSYEMIMNKTDAITIDHDTFYKDEDHKISAKLILLLPLELLVTGDPAGFLKIPDLFEKDKDLFGRENAEDASLFTGVNINSLGIKIDFGYPLFAGSYLHFNEKDEPLFGAEGLHLGNSNHLNINLTNKQRELINNHLIKPDIKFEFKKGKRIQIDRKILPVRIVITANGSYTLNLDDLGLGN